MKRILINGSPRETHAENVAALADALGFVRGGVLIEHNGVALRPDEWSAVLIEEGDCVEVMRIAAGG